MQSVVCQARATTEVGSTVVCDILPRVLAAELKGGGSMCFFPLSAICDKRNRDEKSQCYYF